MRRAPAECRRHRAALTAFAAHREAGPRASGALDHIDRCRACAADLQQLSLAVIALRRLGELPASTVANPAAWPRLRDRIERTRANAAALAWRWRATVAGMTAGTLLVAALVAPLALRIQLGANRAEPAGYSPSELDHVNGQIEQRYIFESTVGALTPAPAETTPTTGSDSAIPTRYPDGITRDVKEVDQRPTRRPPIVD